MTQEEHKKPPHAEQRGDSSPNPSGARQFATLEIKKVK